jgi:hypothetical protein
MSRPNTADLQPQAPPLGSPCFKHELFHHVDYPIVELNDVSRARTPGDVVLKHCDYEALTRHIEVPDTVDEDPDPRDYKGALLHRGHFRT